MNETRTTVRLEAQRRRFYQRLSLIRAVNAIVLVALGLTFAAAVAERLIEPQTFQSFGDAAWWEIVTVTTTGYGDTVPHTVPGKVVAGIVMVNALALVPAVTAVVTALLVRKHESRLPSTPDSHDELLARLERIERLLTAPSRVEQEARNGAPRP
jgi:voltage-gated potassium channel Kch